MLAFMGAMAYAELAALRPKAGGEYVYLREAYGGLAGFLTGWTSFVAGFSGAMAASAVFLITTLDRFVPGIANATPLFAVPVPFTPIVFSFSRSTLAASAVIAVAAFIHIRGVGPGRIASNVLTTLKITAFVVFIAFGLTAGTGQTSNLTQSAGPVQFTGWLFAFIPVMFTYSGWNAAAYMAEEIRDPGRNVPRALFLGTGIVTVIYLLINVLYLYVIPIDKLAGVQGSVLDVVAEGLLGERAGDIMAVVAIVSLAAGINAWTFAGPRVYFAMARDNAFFKGAARVHPKYKTPATSILAQAAFAIVLILIGSLDAIANYVGFSITLFAGAAVAAVFVLARARTERAAALQGARLSGDAGDLRHREPGDRAECVLFRSTSHRPRDADHPGRDSAVLLLSAAVAEPLRSSQPEVRRAFAESVDGTASRSRGFRDLRLLRNHVALVGDLLAGRDAHVEIERLVAWQDESPPCTPPPRGEAIGTCRRSHRRCPRKSHRRRPVHRADVPEGAALRSDTRKCRNSCRSCRTGRPSADRTRTSCSGGRSRNIRDRAGRSRRRTDSSNTAARTRNSCIVRGVVVILVRLAVRGIHAIAIAVPRTRTIRSAWSGNGNARLCADAPLVDPAFARASPQICLDAGAGAGCRSSARRDSGCCREFRLLAFAACRPRRRSSIPASPRTRADLHSLAVRRGARRPDAGRLHHRCRRRFRLRSLRRLATRRLATAAAEHLPPNRRVRPMKC